jgi:methylmalonyl-CoA mutase cobalamin-binding domain/chain
LRLGICQFELTNLPDCSHTEFSISYTKFVTQSGTEVKQAASRKVAQVADKIRVLLAKVGLDGHDRGVRVVARCLRDAGMDVIYTGLHRSPEEVVDAAVQEDVDVLGVSLLSGAHMTAFPRIQKRLKERGVDDIILLGGGVIPDDDVAALKKMGVAEILLQDTPPEVIVETVQRLVRERGPR